MRLTFVINLIDNEMEIPLWEMWENHLQSRALVLVLGAKLREHGLRLDAVAQQSIAEN